MLNFSISQNADFFKLFLFGIVFVLYFLKLSGISGFSVTILRPYEVKG